MAGSSLLLLIDDIASILDDVATMSKVALKKTAGVVGDDLALNAQQMLGIQVDRELPVVWQVAKGSLVNKLILVPAALLISVAIPWAVTPLLMLGGAFLCFEGVEKLVHKYLHRQPSGAPEPSQEAAEHRAHLAALSTTGIDLLAIERDKIRGAVRTDFILSAEIIVIALGTVAAQPFLKQAGVLAAIAIIMTVGVYGLVAAIIKLDDVGLHLSRRAGETSGAQTVRLFGRCLLRSAPYLMRTLSIAGTLAMFMVGGGILAHGIPAAHHLIEAAAHPLAELPWIGGIAEYLTSGIGNIFVGVLAGALCVAVWQGVQRLRAGKRHA